MEKKERLYDFYLTESDGSDSMGYRVKRLNSKGKVVLESWIPTDEFEWFKDKDYKLVDREEFERVGEE